MSELVAVFVAGGAGACLRLVLARTLDVWLATLLPNIGVLIVNLVGSFAIGVLSLVLPEGTLRIAILVGLLGGFTTYSTFVLLLVEMAGEGRWGLAAVQGAAHLIGGIAAVCGGMALGRLLIRAG